MQSVVLVAVGPVQPFIAAARSMRDLWAGSTLLSRVSAVVAKELAGGKPEALVFPAVKTLDELAEGADFPVANRVLAVVEGDGAEAAKSAAERAKSWLVGVGANLLADQQLAPHLRDLALAQIESLMEIHWASVPFEGSWPVARRRVDTLLAARKATRDVAHPPQRGGSETRRKSSIDGLRESVFPELDGPVPEDAEWLCGVSLFKRCFGAGGAWIMSTSGMAAQPTVAQLKAAHQKRYDAFCAEMRTLDARTPPDEDSWLFEDRLTQVVGRDEGKLALAKAAIGRLFAETKLPRPRPYYALLRADGDRMGKLIAAQLHLDEHRSLSTALVGFAQEARRIVQDHKGSAIYTGGDDVLAVLPVSTALPCARQLRACFHRFLDRFRRGENRATISMGLVIAHHMDPLTHTLARSVATEALAKVQRDSLAVCIARRSGGDETVAATWDELSDALEQPAAYLEQGRIPAGLAHELRRAAQRIAGAAEEEKLARAEAARILGRKQPGRGQEKAMDEEVRRLLESGIEARGLGEMATELIVAQALCAETATR